MRAWLCLFISLHAVLTCSIARAESASTGGSVGRRGSSTAKPCTGVPTIPSHRRACNFYIWDAPSALFYSWCHHLLKQNLYEGKGGRMFVRYESNSILQLLYPCSRYSPNRCMVCGGSFPDHLELWWSKHLYSPFCRHLDKTYNDGLLLYDTDRQRGKNKKGRKAAPEVVTAPSYVFHRRYVLDVTHLCDLHVDPQTDLYSQTTVLKAKRFGEKVRRFVKKETSWTGDRPHIHPLVMENKSFMFYSIPAAARSDGREPSISFRIVRGLVQGAVDMLIIAQDREMMKLQTDSTRN